MNIGMHRQNKSVSMAPVCYDDFIEQPYSYFKHDEVQIHPTCCC